MPHAARRITAAALIVGALVAHAALPASAGLGSGDPQLTVSATTVPSDRATNITVRGTDFLVPPHDCPNANVFGGVYVMFGWVETGTAWGPSARNSNNNAGAFGHTYAYPGEGGDANIRDDGTGRIRLVSFTGGGESGAATDFHMDCNGDWAAAMTIHPPTFQYVMPGTGEVRTIDCTALTSGRCGIFTIGAHGKASATNEKFVPVTFTGAAPTTPGSPQGPTGGADPGAQTPGASDPGAVSPGPVDVVEEVVEVRSPFEEASAGAEVSASGFPGLDAGAGPPGSAVAAGVPGATGSPVVVASSGSHTFSPEPTSVVDTGGIPRWLLPVVVLAVLAVAGFNTWRRRHAAGDTEVIA